MSLSLLALGDGEAEKSLSSPSNTKLTDGKMAIEECGGVSGTGVIWALEVEAVGGLE